MPSESEEVWRYSPINRLDLEAYLPVLAPPPTQGAPPPAFLEELGSGAVMTLSNGWLVDQPSPLPPGVAITRVKDQEDPRDLVGSVLGASDALVALHDAFAPDPLVVEVAPGTVVAEPLVVVHRCDGAASGAEGNGGPAPAMFPHSLWRVGRGAQLQVVEIFEGAQGHGAALCLPVTELVVGEGAVCSYGSLQTLGTGAWSIGRLAATVGRDATLRAFTAGLGAAYDRLRSDIEVTGPGGTSELCSMYLGTGDQVHDVRTLQDHAAPSTVSELLCKGAVAGSARSVYSGLIRVRPGAVRTDAMQSNHNLVLGDHAHADSVPNLDIQENDVRCSHASSVGPVDPDELFYLESRGVPPDRAERLIVLGFFDDLIERCPVPPLRAELRRQVSRRLTEALGDGPAMARPADGATVAAGARGGGSA